MGPQKTLADNSYVVYHYSDGSLEYEEHFNATGTLQEVLKYSYDADGNMEYLLYKNDSSSTATAYDLYYYVRNATGDITDLFQVREQSGSGTTVVNRLAAHYEYDPYGNILSINKYNNDPIGDINPIRYKDYYYDLQTGWYQLGSRFYDPEVGRFLNADDVSLLMETDSGIVDKNLYAYCDGNPVMRKDSDGQIWNIVAGAVIGVAVSVGLQLATNILAGDKLSTGLLTAVGAGALTGALAASGVGLATAIGVNAAVAAGKNAIDQVTSGKNFSTGSLLMDTAGGALSGGRGMGNFVKLGTLNRQLTSKVFSGSAKTAVKGVKYYVSQTRKSYSRYIFRPARRSFYFGLLKIGGGAIYHQWKH